MNAPKENRLRRRRGGGDSVGAHHHGACIQFHRTPSKLGTRTHTPRIDEGLKCIQHEQEQSTVAMTVLELHLGDYRKLNASFTCHICGLVLRSDSSQIISR